MANLQLVYEMNVLKAEIRCAGQFFWGRHGHLRVATLTFPDATSFNSLIPELTRHWRGSTTVGGTQLWHPSTCAQVKTKAGNVHAGVTFLENRDEWVLNRGDNAGGFLQLSPEKTKLQLWGEWHVSYPCLSSDKNAKEATRAIRIPIKHSFLALFLSKNYSVIHFIWWTFNYLDELLSDVVLLKRFRWGDFENSVPKSIKSLVNKLNWQKIISGTLLYILEPPPIP